MVLRHVDDQRTAANDVHDVQAAADCEHGDAPGEAVLREWDVRLVLNGMNAVHRLIVSITSVAGRIDVSPAGKQGSAHAGKTSTPVLRVWMAARQKGHRVATGLPDDIEQRLR